MRKLTQYLIFSLLLCLTGAFAQTPAPPAAGNPTFTQQELDQMLAPIALYPDSLLSQILIAATYPLEVVQAARWSSANPGAKGDAAVQAVANENWDPSVKSLVAFPQVLQTLDQKIEWTERLGDAFLAQQPQVMDTVQTLRQKAQGAGNLASNAQINVTQSEGDVDIAPANPDEIYVPYYDPSVVYGSWWWPGYPPIFWSPWAGYGWNGGFAWGFGIGIGADFFFGSWDWHNHRVFAGDYGHRNGGRPGAWQHDPDHRRGVPYRNASLNQRFGRSPASASRADYRGHQPGGNAGPEGRSDRATGRSELPGQLSTRQATGFQSQNRQSSEPRAHAFENVGRGAAARSSSERGHASSSGRSSDSHSGHH
jgi:Protein of unknown function (DUF3300)